MKTLKKLVLIVASLLILSAPASAKIVDFGVKAGLNVNKLSFNKDFAKDLISGSNSTGWEAGVMAELNLPLGLAADVSLMYARMNNSATDAISSDGQDFDGANAGKNFIMIPINLKYKLSLPVVSKYVVPYVFTGPDLAFKLDKEIFNAMKTRTCQVAWNVGLGVQLVSHLQIGASYGFGISNLASKTGLVQASDAKVRNNYWTVTAAWLF